MMPRDFAELTDFQIIEVYYKPAVERAKQFRQGQPQNAESEPAFGPMPKEDMPHPEIDSPLFKDWFVRTTASMWGMERALAEYEMQMKEYREAPADVWWRTQK